MGMRGGYRTCAKVMPVYLARTEASVLAGLAAGLRLGEEGGVCFSFSTSRAII